MKKVFILLLLVIFTGVGTFIIIRNNHHDVKGFELNDYQYYLDNFSSKENVGSIIDTKDAMKKAEAVWISLYGIEVKKEKPYQVFYDEYNDIWLVQGSFKSLFGNSKGGVANILIENKDGQVLAVWHEK